MADKPNWAGTPVFGAAALSAANNVFDGSGTLVTVIPAVSAVTLIYTVEAIATGATSASRGLIYWVRVSGASRWIVEVMLITGSVTPSSTQLPERWTVSRPNFNPIALDIGDSLAAYQTIANPFHVRAFGGRF